MGISVEMLEKKNRDATREQDIYPSRGGVLRAFLAARHRPQNKPPTMSCPARAGRIVAGDTENMAKKMLIDATHAEETRVVVVDGNKVEEFDFESENKRQLAGNIYLAKVTRVEPSLQAAFVDYGGNRHGFLAFSEIHPDYYQIPVADREALLEEERAYVEALEARDEEEPKPKPKRRSRARVKPQAEKAEAGDAVVTADAAITGMETIDLDGESADASAEAGDDIEGLSPMETVAETPVEEPDTDEPPADSRDSAAEADAQESDADEDDALARSRSAAADRDDTIESVADDDDADDIRLPRKPRPRRYKIQEVIKVRQILLIQVVKEERGNKGAALTTYLSLAGRYCVLMPNTARGGGISRKITNVADRKKLKEIANEIEVPRGAGLIVRTAGAKRTKSEIKRDYEYLQRLWEQIRELTLKSIAPAKIYEEGNLIKRSIRDLYNREIDEVLVEGERGYRIAKDFMKMIMPSHAKNVKHYQEGLPLFARFQVESYLSGMFNPTVQLKSGGYIVIGVTEALVAIDVNSGRATKEGSIEETATKTNLEAAEEVARQLRLRDLAGLIVIDFIDMDDRKNNAAVEKRMKEKLKTDRARIQVGRISGFGLMEMSRQRLRPGMIEATTQPCPHCHGTGLIRSDDNMALSILRQIEEEGVRRRSREVLIKAPVGIVNFLINQKREHIAQIEGRYGLAVRIEGDPMLVSPDFTMEKFKTATRNVPEALAAFVSVDSSVMDPVDEDTPDEIEDAPATSEGAETQGQEPPQGDDEDRPKKRRRRRRRKPRSQRGTEEEAAQQDAQPGSEAAVEQASSGSETSEAPPDETAQQEVPKPKRTRSRKKPAEEAAQSAEPEEKAAEPEEKPKPKRTRSRRKPADSAPEASAASGNGPDLQADANPEEQPQPERSHPEKAEETAAARTAATGPESAKLDTAAGPTPAHDVPADLPEEEQPDEQVAEGAEEKTAESGAAEREVVPDAATFTERAEDPDKPRRKGWWSLGS